MSGSADGAITTAELVEILDDEHLEALVIAEEIPAFADEILDQLADDWCRTQHSIDEIRERQRLAGAALAEVVQLPIPANQLSPPGRRAA